MNPATLVYARSSIRRKGPYNVHEITFCILSEEPAREAEIAVFWALEDGFWNRAAAEYVCPSGEGMKLFRASIRIRRPAGQPPAAIRINLNCPGTGHECRGEGTQLFGGRLMAAIDPCLKIGERQDRYPVVAAVSKNARPERVFIRWTPDAWKSLYTTDCYKKKSGTELGAEIWTGLVPLSGAFRIEYAIGCGTRGGEIWDNNLGINFRASRPPLKVLTLNLHCYQEDRQEDKFWRIAAAVEKLRIDILCLQEVGERWNRGKGCWRTNAAKKIADRLREPYHILADWSHIGFGRYREGVAILSRYPLLRGESRYVSENRDPGCIHARKVCMGRVQVPHVGEVDVFSVHLSWWEEGFREQAENLFGLAERFREPSVSATLLCGDFNVAAGSEGYRMITGRYDDQLLQEGCGIANGSPEGGHSPAGGGRIDFIFMNRGGGLKAVQSRPLFTDADYGRVSDHCGYLVGFEPR